MYFKIKEVIVAKLVFSFSTRKAPLFYTRKHAITFIIWNLINTTNDGSHKDREGLNLDIIDFVDNQNTEYLFKGNIFRLFDILIYFKEYIDKMIKDAESHAEEDKKFQELNGYDTEKHKATDEVYNNLHHCCQYERKQ